MWHSLSVKCDIPLDLFKYRVKSGQGWVVDRLAQPVPGPCILLGQVRLSHVFRLDASGRVGSDF